MATNKRQKSIIIVSGGVGASGEQLVQTVLAQFPEHQAEVIIFGNVRRIEQIEGAIERAKNSGGILVHTLVDASLRQTLIEKTDAAGIVTIDLVGPLITHLAEFLQQEALGHPGLYRKLHKDYFDRVGAIEYTMAHDDGKDPAGWAQAEIILVGVSRSGKTPLSLYLSVLGWKVANYPLVRGVRPPDELYQLDRRCVVGLTIEPGQLLLHRQQRQLRLGAPGPTSYVDPTNIYDEVEEARKHFKANGFTLVDVTDKPIESIADEIIRRISPHISGEKRTFTT